MRSAPTRTAEELAELMAANAFSPQEQVAQTRFRMQLAEDWAIPEGARILEIGCGQGDMTAVLAETVGPTGHVTAVDLAVPTYGRPVSLGDSAQFLKEGPLSERIDFHFEFDVLDPANAFQPKEFDLIVLAHCTWYFDSLERLEAVFQTIKPWTNRLCLSEWDLEPRSTDQFGHWLAVLIQGQLEAFKPQSEANVRTPYSRETLRGMLARTGWEIDSDRLIETSNLADARWEIAGCLSPGLMDEAEIPPRLKTFIESQLQVLQRVSTVNRPLPAYSIVAST